MMIMKKYSFTAVAIALSAMTWSMTAQAQDDYEDDIYYNPSKSEAKASQPVQQHTISAYQPGSTVADGAYYIDKEVGSFPSSDSYTAGAVSPLEIDVDTYNRRGQFLVADTIVDSGSDSEDSFASTRRIERFHNPDIVEGSGDDALMDYYYAEQPATNVNVYVIEANPFYSPYYYTPWSYRSSLYYNPYYWGFTTWGWDPYWSISWGYDPYWSWGWGYYPGWDWCHHGYYPGHHHHDYGHWQPAPGGSHHGGGYRPSHNSGSHTASAVSGVQRPGNMGRGRVSSGSASSTISRRQSLTGGRTTFRPIGNSTSGRSTGVKTGDSGNNATTISRPGNMGSGRSVSKQSSTYQPAPQRSSSNSSSSSNSYTPSSSSRGRSSSGSSFSSGSSRSSHSMGGGSRSMGGGGGSRGRR